ncbi:MULTISPECIES: MTH1187 family thiamine-binding protein [Bacillales]|uniref:MTH1187 family thiamine-binding protein n=1 Tax=Bacillales TaxID=1385 RepID=UPI0018846049|nr:MULTISPECIES: MTH1187 family thiamine-binding protein [Bacillaceae]MBF0709259.1 MTH1187 family thiamine-binding protein [Pseudalkalibacillus hwajinpoensis]MDO6655129.1 MTH1187 family thiamine-binding protein [Anaerobacillus sp. 1_MG-2023]
MAIVDVTVIPIGTETPSVSKYVAEVQKILESYSDRVTYRLTPMSTLIEGEIADLLEVVHAIHEAPFQAGIERVATNLRIDDRRDKKVKMDDKLDSVNRHLE